MSTRSETKSATRWLESPCVRSAAVKRGIAEPDDEHQDRERAEGVHVVGRPELPAANERVAEARALDERRRHRKPDEGEPRDARQDDDRPERRERQVDETRRRGTRPPSVAPAARSSKLERTPARSAARPRGRRGSARPGGGAPRAGRRSRAAARAGARARSCRRRRGSSRRRTARRSARRAAAAAAGHARATSAISRGSAAASAAFASSNRQRDRSGSPIAFASTRISTARHPCERRGAEDGVALHRLDLAPGRAAHPRARPDRRHGASGSARARCVDERWVGRNAQLDPAGVVGVAVDGFAPDHERPARRTFARRRSRRG